MGLWSDPARRASPFHERDADPRRADAARRIEAWTRVRFALDERVAVLVTEERSTLPGFPPLETRVHFRAGDERPCHFRVFKPIVAVESSDVPPAWMREALAQEAPDCNCC